MATPRSTAGRWPEEPEGSSLRRHAPITLAVDGTADLETGREPVLVETGDIAFQMPVHAVTVSPDASRLAVALASREPGMLIRVYPMEGGEGRTVAELDRPVWGTSLAFSADGTTLYFSDRVNEGFIRPHPDGRRIATVTGMLEVLGHG
jgi:hypothetical protein